ncbi:cupredoxin domain-containing protein [Caldinitratiruptor microaerophilus]|uniref:EfeO-type cupredoxin-like domain-containing protein n=1 Tax=Caldinitratiruptor microaerophilus TaxID=671077 RepID=A0AA35G759_9FIRM|nr:cupredoxin domain-containing protein [Caldinitratiruptor microaerophilus]BDG58953.1 hypothetical protein caldi_00430 [Caldinitratiruptor microaerophilus]
MCSRSRLTALVLAVLPLLLAGCSRSGAAAPAGSPAHPAVEQAVAGADVVVEVHFRQPAGKDARWAIEPARIEVPLGSRVALVAANDEPLPHDLVIGEPYNQKTVLVRRGEKAAVVFTADRPTAGTPVWCSVPGHRELGMEAVLVVR